MLGKTAKGNNSTDYIKADVDYLLTKKQIA